MRAFQTRLIIGASPVHFHLPRGIHVHRTIADEKKKEGSRYRVGVTRPYERSDIDTGDQTSTAAGSGAWRLSAPNRQA